MTAKEMREAWELKKLQLETSRAAEKEAAIVAYAKYLEDLSNRMNGKPL